MNKRLEDKSIVLELTEKAKEFLVEKGYQPKLGARPLRRTIETELENPLSEELLRGAFANGSKIKVNVKDDKIVFSGKADPALPVPAGRQAAGKKKTAAKTK